jgi:diadenosine tetraphosphate (Ap4A) HIT family hydrolase
VSGNGFHLHERLAEDCHLVGDLPVSRALLMNDSRYPWVILVPRLPDLRELHDLPAQHRLALMAEIEAVSRALTDLCSVTKINVGALGNLVEQLHVHVVGRTPDDPAWPGPVWGSGAPEPYEPAGLEVMARRLREVLGLQRAGERGR